MDESKRQKLDRIRSSVKEQREQFIPLWRQEADHFLPYRGRWLNEKPGEKIRRNIKIINETPLLARRTFSAGLMAGGTNQSRPWFRLKTKNDAVMEAEGVRTWLYSVETAMRNVFSGSNFYNSLRPCYDEYGTFGTLALGIFQDDDKTIRCCPYTAGSYYISNNEKGEVDTFVQEFKWTVRQIVKKFGLSNCSNAVQRAWQDSGRREQFVDVAYCVYPNDMRDVQYADARGMAFTATYYECDSGAGEQMLEEKGYREFPVMVARLAPNEGDAYGNGLALDCLGSAMALQLQEKRKAQVIDKEVDPPMRANPALKNQPASQLPGDITYVDPSGNGALLFEPVSQWKPDRSGMLEDISSIEERIRQTMFADIFALFIQGQEKDMTATEITAKQQEKLMMLGPVLDGLNFGLLNPAIDRTFNIMLRMGQIPPPPQALQGQVLKVEYVSVLAQAQNILAVQGVNQFVNFVLSVASQQVASQQEPTALDKLDVDQAMDEYANLSGVVPTIVRSDDQVAELRDARAKQQAAIQQAQAAAQAVQVGAGAAKDLSQAKLGQGSALDALAS